MSRNQGDYDPQGVHIPVLWADEKEIFALGDVLREMGTGIIQSGGGRAAETNDGLMARLSEATGRTVIYNNLGQTVREPDAWKRHMARVEETSKAGYPKEFAAQPEPWLPKPLRCATARSSAARRPGTQSRCRRTRKSSRPMPTRRSGNFDEEVVEHSVNVPAAGYSREWYNEYGGVETPVLDKNQGLKGKTIGQIAKEQNKRVIDAFLDLVVEENLYTWPTQSKTMSTTRRWPRS